MMKIYLPHEERKVAIYALVDPRKPSLIRYVGQSKTPMTRHLLHITSLDNPAKSEWIETMRQDGVLPQMIIIEWTKENESDFREKHYMQLYASDLLTNINLPKLTKEKPKRKLDSELTARELQEKEIIKTKLMNNKGNKQKTAFELGISRCTMYKLLRIYGLFGTLA